jgi:hypothetical protein
LREVTIATELQSVETLEAFGDFIEDGIAFLIDSLQTKADEGNVKGMKADALKGDTLQRMRDVKCVVDKSVERLKTGLQDGANIFSTDADDYLNK